MPPTNDATRQARVMFLNKIRDRLAEEGRPLSGFALEYWHALEPVDEVTVERPWKDKACGKELAAIEKEFEFALQSAIEQDLLKDIAAKDVYLRGLNNIAREDGGQLQAIVFAAALRVPTIADADQGNSKLILFLALGLVALGGWIGLHFHK